MAERYSLLLIITLGEGVIGTVAALSTAVGEQGWSFESIAVVVAGVGLTFGLWWIYGALLVTTLAPWAVVLGIEIEGRRRAKDLNP